MSRIKIDNDLYERAARCAREKGYSSVDEFVSHLVERALREHEAKDKDEEAEIEKRLRGLGYIE
jgi:predicted CopG family antitoxin